MNKFTKGLIVGMGTGAVTGIGASIMMLVMVEKQAIRTNNNLDDTARDLIDYLNTDEGAKNKCLFGDLIEELTALGEIRIGKVFKNLAKAMEIDKNSKEQLKGFLSDENN